MELFRAKIKGSGTDIIVIRKNYGEYLFVTYDNIVYKADELEFVESISVQEEHFWRNQRVEIVKSLLQRKDLSLNASVGDIVDVAEEFVRKLKALGD